MIDRLPYELTRGVTATREGLQFDSPLMVTVEYFPYDIASLDEPLTISWHDAAERLRYREGEPWCATYQNNEFIVFWPGRIDAGNDNALHRLAAILCDDAEAFRILYWCITNLTEDT